MPLAVVCWLRPWQDESLAGNGSLLPLRQGEDLLKPPPVNLRQVLPFPSFLMELVKAVRPLEPFSQVFLAAAAERTSLKTPSSFPKPFKVARGPGAPRLLQHSFLCHPKGPVLRLREEAVNCWASGGPHNSPRASPKGLASRG